jgi:hypothetical protein
MKKVVGYLSSFVSRVDKRELLLTSFLVSLFIFINYHFGLDEYISKQSFFIKLLAWFTVFLIAYGLAWLSHYVFNRENAFSIRLLFIILVAPLIFSLKLSAGLHFHYSDDPYTNRSMEYLLSWPVLLFIITLCVLFVWRIIGIKGMYSFGLTTHHVDWKPYLWMLLIMVPLILLAASQPDFRQVYPKIHAAYPAGKEVSGIMKLLFELSYGSDFFTIEFFFRGALVVALVKIAGRNAILPMAAFYSTIHFGKPLGECISSYFGGMILGVIAFETRSILGGLLVHLGIAWMMEIAALLF